MPVEKYKLGTIATIFTTELNSLANNSNVVTTTPFDNTQGSTGDGYTMAEIELVVQFGTAPTSGTGVSVWFLRRPDGTNYEDGSASITPARMADVTIPVRNVNTAQRIVREFILPPGVCQILLRNNGTGQPFAATNNTLKIRPVTVEGV